MRHNSVGIDEFTARRFFLGFACTICFALMMFLVISTWSDLRTLNHLIQDRLAHYNPENSSTILAQPGLLYKGMTVQPEWLREYLEKANYVASSGSTILPAEFEFQKDEIEFAQNSKGGARILVTFNRKGVEKIRNLSTGREMRSLPLDPEVLERFFGNSDQAKSSVQLKEVPKYFVQAVVAIEDRRF